MQFHADYPRLYCFGVYVLIKEPLQTLACHTNGSGNITSESLKSLWKAIVMRRICFALSCAILICKA